MKHTFFSGLFTPPGFQVSTVNFLTRSTLAVAGVAVQHDAAIASVQLILHR